MKKELFITCLILFNFSLAKSDVLPQIDMNIANNTQSVEQEKNDSFGQQLKKASQGEMNAIMNVAITYLYGSKDIQEDIGKASFWFEKAIKEGNSDAFYYMGVINQRKKDYKAAITWLQRVANKGDPYAQSGLGYMYTVGLGVDKDYKQAKNWYEKAALQQDAYAQFVLGYLYQNGFGVSQNYNKAKEWYEKSADLGDLGALNNLAQIYEKGYGVKKNPAYAIELYS